MERLQFTLSQHSSIGTTSTGDVPENVNVANYSERYWIRPVQKE